MTRNFSPNIFKNGGEGRRRAALSGSSLAALALAAAALPAQADTTVGGDRTTPIATSTAASGAPDNVVINSGGSVKPGSGVAVTLDSDNTVLNGGTIQIQDQSNATGVLALGGHTGAVSNTGTITINETTTPTDTNGDGNLDGPLATGANRFGIRLTGSQPFIGAISNSGTISVTGDASAGISLEAPLQGSLSTSGAISVIGTGSYGIRTLGVSGGGVTVAGAVSAQGQGAQGIAIGGDVAGQVLIQSSVTATGYRYATRSTDATFVSKLGADDLLQGGPAISVAGSVAQGLLIDTAGSVVSSGAAPGLVIGAVGRDLALGNVGTDADAYGLEVKGVLDGLGVYDGVTATGLQLGVADGGQVTTGGGVHVTGSISAVAAQAGATAVMVNSGVSVPLFQNDGVISASVTATGAAPAKGLVIGAGASVPAFANSASLSAAVTGSAGDAIALQDQSGTLSSIQNIRTIAASVFPTAGQPETGRAIAIDVSANSTGVNLLQYDTSAGVALPSIAGAIRFGAGSDSADIQAGTVTGDIAFGAGANRLSISGGAQVTGALTADGGTLAVAISNGGLQMTNVGRVNLSSLTLGAQSALTFTIDPQAGTSTSLLVGGPATLADGAKIGLRFTSLLQGSASYTLIQASQLSAGAIDTSLLGQTPFIYKASLSTDAAQGTLTANVSLKSAAELGLSTAVAGAYGPAFAAIGRAPALRDAILAQTDRGGFLAAFNQLLPSRSGAVFQLAAAAADGIGRALDDRVSPIGGAWIEELNFGVTDKSRDGLPGYNAYGVGLAGGYEAAFAPAAIFGVDFGFSSSQVRELANVDTSKFTVESFGGGLYWRGVVGRLSANARIGADYLKLDSDRVIAITDVAGATFGADATSKWSGSTLTGRVHLGYEAELGALYLRPQASLDYVRLNEGGHSETGGGGGVDLAIQSRTSSRTSAFAGLALGKTFGDDATWGPELLVGYRDVMSENLGDTTARFVSGGDAFTLPGAAIGGQGFSARLAFKGENGYGGFALEGGAEARDGLNIYDVRLTAHVQF